MKIYKIYQDVNLDYDTYDSAVVCAENEEKAKSILPSGGVFKERTEEDEYDYMFSDWVEKFEDIKCEYIGEAREDLGEGVIVASFNAG